MADYSRDIRDEIAEYGKAKDMFTQYQNKIIEAIVKQQVNVCKTVLASGLDVNFCHRNNKYPIHYATELPVNTESTAIFNMLLYSGADVEVTDRFGNTPLHLAVKNCIDRVVSLLDTGCCVDVQDNGGSTPLMAACTGDSPDMLSKVQLLLDHGCNVFLRDGQQYTPLHYICQNHTQDLAIRREIIYKLLYCGLSPSAQDHLGRIPLCHELDRFICYHRKLTDDDFMVVKTLISVGRNFNFTNKNLNICLTCLMLSCSTNFLTELFQITMPVIGQKFACKIYKMYLSEANGDKHLSELLQKFRDTPRSLKSICRYSIRAQLKDRLLMSRDLLPLPLSIRDYIYLHE